MKHWGNALFPLSILLVLALLTFWLRYVTELDEPVRDGKNRHDPDYILSEVLLRKLDTNGQLEYTLRATESRHYPDDNSTDLVRPWFMQQGRKADTPPATIEADRGRVSEDNDRIDLYDNVRIYRAPFGKHEELTASMNALTLFLDDELAVTQSPVVLTQGNSWVKGVGMRFNRQAQTYLIESQAVGFMERKRAGGKS